MQPADKPYKPVDCNFYDELVLLAMKKSEVTILPYPWEEYEAVRVLDIYTQDGAEYMKFSNDKTLRLDFITALDEDVLILNTFDFMQEEE